METKCGVPSHIRETTCFSAASLAVPPFTSRVSPEGLTELLKGDIEQSDGKNKITHPLCTPLDAPSWYFLSHLLSRMTIGFGASPTGVTWAKSLNHSRGLIYRSYYVAVFSTQYFSP